MEESLYSGLEKLKLACGFQNISYFPAFIPNSNDVFGSGILELVKFRLQNRESSVVFFSFHDKSAFKLADKFTALGLPGTEFIRLPISLEELTKKMVKFSSANTIPTDLQWNAFCEPACEYLLKISFSRLTHGREFDIANNVLVPLRASFIGLLSSPQLHNHFRTLCEKNLLLLREFLCLPLISQMIQLSSLCKSPTSSTLATFRVITQLLLEISDFNTNIETNIIITAIDELNKLIRQIEGIEDGTQYL